MIFELLTVSATGLLAGALLAEAGVLVPYWIKMPIAEFLRLHHTMASSLYRFYAPLTILGTVLPVLMAVVAIFSAENAIPWLVSGFCATAMLLFYFLFFKKANEHFATVTDPDIAQATLLKWASLHKARTLVATIGFLAAVVGVNGS